VLAEILLGGGLVNFLYGRISIFNPVGDLRYKFVFDHQAVDGYSFLPAGTGYSRRSDMLDGDLKRSADRFDLELGGTYTDREIGLQGQSPSYSESLRFLSGNGLLAYSPVDFFTLSTRVSGAYSLVTLTGAPNPSYSGHTELDLSGSLSWDFTFKPGNGGLGVDYSYRSDLTSSIPDLHRLYANGHLGADFDNGFSILAKGGFFYESTGAWYVPFEGRVSGVVSDKLSIGLSGGYRVTKNNVKDLLDTFAYTLPPDFIPDSSGWFGTGNAQVSLFDALLLNLEGGVSSDSLLFTYGDLNPATGLFDLDEIANPFSLTLGGGLVWNLADWLTFSAKDKLTLFLNVPVAPRNDLCADAKVSLANDAFTADCSLSMPVDFERPDFLPFLGLDMTLAVAEHVRASLEGKDLLAPVLDNKRYVRDPYISEGIQVLFKILVNF
jgi:hypothetical protein